MQHVVGNLGPWSTGNTLGIQLVTLQREKKKVFITTTNQQHEFWFSSDQKAITSLETLGTVRKAISQGLLLTVEPSKDVCGPDSKALSPPLSRASTAVCGTRRGLRLQSSQHKHRPRQLLLKEPSFSPGPGLLLPPCSTLSLMLAEHSRFIGYTVNQAGELTWPKMDKF